MKYIIFGQPNCAYCQAAKNYLPFAKYLDIIVDSNFDKMQELFPGSRQVPKIVEYNDDGSINRKFESYANLVREF